MTMRTSELRNKTLGRFITARLEKVSNDHYIDAITLLEKFEDFKDQHARSIYTTDKQLFKSIEAAFDVTLDETTQRFSGLRFKEIDQKRPEPPKVSPHDAAMTVRFESFLSQRMPSWWRSHGFSSKAFAEFATTHLVGGQFYEGFRPITEQRAQAWLKRQQQRLRYDDATNLWFVLNPD